jgi:hypothetical protein
VADASGDDTTDALHFYRPATDEPKTCRFVRIRQAPTVAGLDGDGDTERSCVSPENASPRLGGPRQRQAVEHWSRIFDPPVVDAAPSHITYTRIRRRSEQRDRATLVALGGDGRPWEALRRLPSSAKPEVIVGEFTLAAADVWGVGAKVEMLGNRRCRWPDSREPAVFATESRVVADTNRDGDDIIAVSSARRHDGLAGTRSLVRSTRNSEFATPPGGRRNRCARSQSKLAKAKSRQADWSGAGRADSSLLPGLNDKSGGTTVAIGGNFGNSTPSSPTTMRTEGHFHEQARSSRRSPPTPMATAAMSYFRHVRRVVALESGTGVEVWLAWPASTLRWRALGERTQPSCR